MFVAQATRVALPSTRGAPAPGRGARVAHRRAVLPRATNLNATARVVVPAHVHPARPPAFASHASSGGPSGFRAHRALSGCADASRERAPFPRRPSSRPHRPRERPRARRPRVSSHPTSMDRHPRHRRARGRCVARRVVLRLHAPRVCQVCVSRDASPVVAAAAAGESTGAVVGTVALLVVYAFFCISETAITTLWPWKVREISDQRVPTPPSPCAARTSPDSSPPSSLAARVRASAPPRSPPRRLCACTVKPVWDTPRSSSPSSHSSSARLLPSRTPCSTPQPSLACASAPSRCYPTSCTPSVASARVSSTPSSARSAFRAARSPSCPRRSSNSC